MWRHTSSDKNGNKTSYGSPPPRFDTKSSFAQFEAYWHAKRHGNLVPRRGDIDPRGLTNILGQIFLIERIADGHADIRVAGHDFYTLFGSELRGLPFSMLFSVDARPMLEDMLRDTFSRPALLRATLRSRPQRRQPSLEAQMMLAPLEGYSGQVTRAIGMFEAYGPRPTLPPRFDITSVAAHVLLRTVPNEVPKPPKRRGHWLSQDPAPTSHPKVPPSRHGKRALRLIYSADAIQPKTFE
ncbi:MAG: PAS domain-containing protein [Halocynthiibacter sp.]